MIGSQFLLTLDRWTDVRRQSCEVKLGRVYPFPALMGEPWLQPCVRLSAGVDRLTVVDVVEHHCGRAGGPALIGDDGLDVAIRKLDLKLREGGKLLAVVAPAAAPAEPPAKPAIAERNGENRCGLKQRSHVVAAVTQPPLVAAPPWT